jgi:DNA-binding transcriptional LysR family regulator
LELTSFGNKIYHLFADEYVLANNKLNILNDDSHELAGSINLCIPPIFAQKAIAGDLNEFLAKYPQLQINFSAFNFSELYNHAFDLAISTQMPENESYLVRKLYSCSKMLFAAPKYTTEYGTPSTIAELAEHKLLLDINNGMPAREINLFDKNGEGNQFVITNSNLAFDNLFYGLEMVLHGYGICVLPYFMAKPYLAKGELVRVLPEYIAAEFSFYLIRSNIKITKKENEVVKFLQHIIEQYFDAQE